MESFCYSGSVARDAHPVCSFHRVVGRRSFSPTHYHLRKKPLELHLHWCLVQSEDAGGPRTTLGGNEFDLSDVELSHTELAASLVVGMNEGLASYLTWLFSRPDEQMRSAVCDKAERDAVPPPVSALAINAAAFEFLQRSKDETTATPTPPS